MILIYFIDSDNEDLQYKKSKLSTTSMINYEHLNDRSSSPTILDVPVAVNGNVILYFIIVLSSWNNSNYINLIHQSSFSYILIITILYYKYRF